MGPSKCTPSKVNEFVPQEKMYNAYLDYLHFNEVLGIRNVGQLNKAVDQNLSADLINVAEALHDKKIAAIADEITRRYRDGGARIVLVAGPSSSGKTTTTKRLGIYLMANLLKPRIISLDNYFVNREHTPLDADGDYDLRIDLRSRPATVQYRPARTDSRRGSEPTHLQLRAGQTHL